MSQTNENEMLNPRIDLSLIFERDDIREVVTAHCSKSHDDTKGYEHCEQCMVLRAIIASAIVEWRDGCELQASVAPPVSGWRAIDSAPKDGTPVLVWDGNDCMVSWYHTVSPEFLGEWYTLAICAEEPTHWMPLPSPPTLSDPPVDETAPETR